MKDHLGNVRAIMGYENNVYEAYDYDPWGHIIRNYNTAGESFYTPNKFTGKERDKESNYDYFGARYYDSRIGNWISVDPLMEKSISFSPYSYVLRNPLIYIDPKGEEWFYVWDEGGVSGHWEFFEDEKEKTIWNGKRDEKGNKIYQNQTGYKELLTFDGSKLTWLKENGGFISWSAVAGVLKDEKTQPDLQYVEDIGPIPSGFWVVDPKKTLSRYTETSPIQKLIWDYEYGSWGYYKTPIDPIGSTYTNGRGGFTIHGGTVPGSKGCIDLTGLNDNFHKVFLENNKEMILHVDYSKIKY